jgi:hypothetical protein
MASNARSGWLAVPIILFLAVTGIFWPFLDDEEPADTLKSSVDDVVVLNWKWNRSVSGHIFAVFGELENKGSTDLLGVLLELRTVDADDNTLNRHRFQAGEILAGQRKHFRHDIPRSGKEERGHMTVVETTPSSPQ